MRLRFGRLSPLHLLLVVLPGLITLILLVHFATSAPMLDDFADIVWFASRLHTAPGFSAKLGVLLFTQAAFYKLIFLHSLVALELGTLGHLNIGLLVLVGDLSLFGSFWFLARNTDLAGGPQGSQWLRLLPVSLLFFGLNYAETVDWALCSLQQVAGIFFSLGALHFLVRSSRFRCFMWACVFAVLAVCSNAPGLLVFPVGLWFLSTNDTVAATGEPGVSRSRRTRYLITWSGLFLACALLYFSHYEPAGLTGQASLGSKTLFVVMFCGSSFENMHHQPVPYLSAVLGCLVIATLAVAGVRRYDRTHPFFFLSGVWLLLTAGAVANARIALGLQLSLSGRYKIYCVLLLICCYEFFLDRLLLKAARATPDGTRAGASPAWPRAFLLTTSLGTAVLFCASEAVGAKFLATRQARANQAQARYLASQGAESPMFLVSEHLSPGELAILDLGRRQLNEAVALGIYRVPWPEAGQKP